MSQLPIKIHFFLTIFPHISLFLLTIEEQETEQADPHNFVLLWKPGNCTVLVQHRDKPDDRDNSRHLLPNPTGHTYVENKHYFSVYSFISICLQ